MARGGGGGGGLWAPEMKTKAERKDGGREWDGEREGGKEGGWEDTANPDSFRGEQRRERERESGATRGRPGH